MKHLSILYTDFEQPIIAIWTLVVLPRLIHVFFPQILFFNEKRFASHFLQSLHDGLACNLLAQFFNPLS